MVCPRCGSHDVHIATVSDSQTTEKVKGFGCIKACIGWLLFSLPGILCGLCGMGKTKRTTTVYSKVINICKNCGYRF